VQIYSGIFHWIFLQSLKISPNYDHASVAALFWRTVFIVDASQKRRLVTGDWLHGRKRHTSRGQRWRSRRRQLLADVWCQAVIATLGAVCRGQKVSGAGGWVRTLHGATGRRRILRRFLLLSLHVWKDDSYTGRGRVAELQPSGMHGWSKVLRPTRHIIGHFGDGLPSQSLGSVLNKTQTHEN